MGRPPGPTYYVGVTPVGSGARHPSLGLILPPTTQGELRSSAGATSSSTGGGTGSAPDLVELCRRAEATGADSLWAVDHLFWPHPMGESLTTLAVAAVATSRPTLGTCVLQLPLRRPAAVAKQATALQLLSGGRFVLGLGVGIHEGEYERAGVDFHRRGRLLDEGVAGLRAAWGATGRSRTPSTSRNPPRPPCRCGSEARATRPGGGPPPWATAGSPSSWRPDEYAAGLEALGRETADAGRAPEAVEAAVVVFACVGDDDEAPARGAAWLSHLYRLPPKAFRAPSRGGIARDVRRRAAALRRRRGPPHRRDGGRVARRRALRPAARRVRRRRAPALTGVPA